MWLRIAIAAAAAVGTVFLGLFNSAFDAAPGETGIAAGANRFALVLVAAVLVAIIAYAAIEWLQTRRLDSIVRQFSTRVIVLMPIAIAINIVLGQTVGTALKLPVYLDSIGTILVGVLAGPLAGAATGLISDLAWTFILGGTPFGSPYAWPFAIVAAEIGFVAGIAGWLGAFRSRPGTPAPRLLAGIVVAVALVGGLIWFGILPFFANLCAPGGSPAGCFDLVQPAATADPLFAALAIGLAVILVGALAALVVRLIRKGDLGVVVVAVVGVGCGVISAFIAAPISTIVFGGVSASGTDLLVAAFQQVGSSLGDAVLQQALISDTIDKTIEYLVVFTLLGAVSRRVLARFPQGECTVGLLDDQVEV